jgi:hypothetical protein
MHYAGFDLKRLIAPGDALESGFYIVLTGAERTHVITVSRE